MSFTDFENQLLVASYLLSERKAADMIRAGEAVETFGLDWRPGWINRAIAGLISLGYSDDARTIGGETDQDVWLTAAGYRRAEELLPYIELREISKPPVRLTANTPVPASDRLVALDHNNPNLAKAIGETKQLAAQLQESNDVGNMSPEAVAVAVEEVTQIAATLEAPAVRMPAFGDRVVSTLSWIGKEAGGALVGAAALGLLALLATILGIAL